MIRLLRVAALAVLIGGVFGTAAWADGSHKVVHYHGLSLRVPAGWPVYDLTAHPATCVRFNRHAVYLGSPSAEQRCPAHQIGRTDAILIENPVRAASGAAGAALPAANGHAARVRLHGLRVTATWSGSSTTVARALGLRGLHATPDATARSAAGLTASAAAGEPRPDRLGRHRPRVRPVRHSELVGDVGVEVLVVPLRWRLPRRREHGLQPAEPDDVVGPL